MCRVPRGLYFASCTARGPRSRLTGAEEVEAALGLLRTCYLGGVGAARPNGYLATLPAHLRMPELKHKQYLWLCQMDRVWLVNLLPVFVSLLVCWRERGGESV